MPVTAHNAVVLSLENKSWLGNQHGKHASNIQRHLLCLATGRNLVCCVCFFVMLLSSLEQCGQYKRKCFCISAQAKSLSGDLCYQVSVCPITHQKEKQWGPPLLFTLISSSPHTQLGTFSISSSERLGIDCFYEMNMTQKSIQHDRLVHLKASSAGFPITQCLSSCLLKHSLN